MIWLKRFIFRKKYLFLFFGVAIVAASFWSYQSYIDTQAVYDDITDTFEEGIPSKCENGEWIEFPDLQNSSKYEVFAGNVKLKYDEKKDIFTDAGGTQVFSTDKYYPLSFFMDRDAWVDGYRLSDTEIYVKKIKCTGEEANKDILQAKRKLMNYIKNNINTLALEKASKNDWQVGSFYFASDTDVYVQYESQGSFIEEEPYDSHLWLIRVSNLDRTIPKIETLTYIQEDAEDPEKNIVKYGEDLYKDAKNLVIYEFDEDVNQWVLQ